MAPSAFPPPGCPTPGHCEVAGCSNPRGRCGAQLPAIAAAPIPLPALDRPVGGWSQAIQRLFRKPAEAPPASRPGRPMAPPAPRRSASPHRRPPPPAGVPADVPFMLTEDMQMPEIAPYPPEEAWTQPDPAPAETAWTQPPPPPPPPHRPRPSQPATVVPVSNGFVWVVDGRPVAVAGLEEDQLGQLARDWARGLYGT